MYQVSLLYYIFQHVYTSFCNAVGIVPSRYVSFRGIFTISNSASFTWHGNSSLKSLVQYSENMSPLSFLINTYLVFSHSLKPISEPTCCKGVLLFGYQWYHLPHKHIVGVEHIQNKSCEFSCILYQSDKGWRSSWKTKYDMIYSGLLKEGHLCWLYFHLHHESMNILRWKRIVQTHQRSGLGNEELTQPISHLSFHWRSHVNKTGTQVSNRCGTVSSSYWNGLHHWVVKLRILVCRRVGSKNHWNQIWPSALYYCFILTGYRRLWRTICSEWLDWVESMTGLN